MDHPPPPQHRRSSPASAVCARGVVGFALLFGTVAPQLSRPVLAAPREEPDAAKVRRAEAMATEAKALFQNRVYLDAARLFMEAFAISRRAPLVYNAARAYEEGGQLKRAESLFLLYLSLPDADEAGKGDASEHLESVRERLRIAAQTTDAAPPTQPTPPPSTHATAPSQRPRWPWIGAGASMVAAGGLYTFAWVQANDLDVADVVDASSRDAYAHARDRVAVLRWSAVGCLAVAGGFAAYGIIDALRAPTAEVRVFPVFHADGGVGFVGVF